MSQIRSRHTTTDSRSDWRAGSTVTRVRPRVLFDTTPRSQGGFKNGPRQPGEQSCVDSLLRLIASQRRPLVRRG